MSGAIAITRLELTASERHEAGTRNAHGRIFGNLVVLLEVADSKNAAAYEAAAYSLKLVAGAGNHRYRHCLQTAV